MLKRKGALVGPILPESAPGYREANLTSVNN